MNASRLEPARRWGIAVLGSSLLLSSAVVFYVSPVSETVFATELLLSMLAAGGLVVYGVSLARGVVWRRRRRQPQLQPAGQSRQRAEVTKWCLGGLLVVGGLGVFTVDNASHDPQTLNTITDQFDGMIELRLPDDGGREMRIRGFDGQSTGWLSF